MSAVVSQIPCQPKHRDILTALDNDVLALIGKAVVAKREETTLSYHQDQYGILRGLLSISYPTTEHQKVMKEIVEMIEELNITWKFENIAAAEKQLGRTPTLNIIGLMRVSAVEEDHIEGLVREGLVFPNKANIFVNCLRKEREEMLAPKRGFEAFSEQAKSNCISAHLVLNFTDDMFHPYCSWCDKQCETKWSGFPLTTGKVCYTCYYGRPEPVDSIT